jgi:hypothetical protein
MIIGVYVKNISKITDKIKEKVGVVDNLSKFNKFSKLRASYIEYDKFSDSNLHEGYFCYNYIYWINAGGGNVCLWRMMVQMY